jgi:peptidoglycan hydrolase-like protein with peptidoglycan-binding domain
MRFAWGALALVLTLPFFVAAQTVCSPLSRGATGPAVLALQTFLHESYTDFSTPTGYFGPVTEAAVKQWQSEHGIVSSGSPATTGWGAVGGRALLLR